MSHTSADLFARHAKSFMAKDVEGLSSEYDEKSIMKLSVDQGAFATFTGWSEIKPVFEGLFDGATGQYGDGATVSVQGAESTPTTTVLLWSSAGGPKDVKRANDTFIINPDTNKWSTQTVFVHHASVGDILKTNELFDDIAGLADAYVGGGDLSVEYKNASVTPNATLKAGDTHNVAPKVTLTGIPANGQKYTLIMTDPDALSRKEPIYREYIHWVVSDITAESLAQGAIDGTTQIGYAGVGAPHASGPHRYVQLLFAQPDGADCSGLADAFAGRGGKKACVIAKAAGLGPVVAANFFQSSWEESVDARHAAWGFAPPARYRSPQQLTTLGESD